MENLTFNEVAELISFSKITIIDSSPIAQEKGKWALYKGKNKVPPFEYEFFILYFLADATLESISKATNYAKEKTKTHVVYADSLNKKFQEKDFKKLVPTGYAEVSTTKEYLLLFIKDKIDYYCTQFKDIPKFYTEPRFNTPSGFKKKVPNPLLNFLKDETIGGDVAILIAEPGQGKTYTTEYLASRMCQQGIIPIYIQSNQWANLSAMDLSSLWKTITHSFKHYGSQIEWIEGHEREFLSVTLKAGIFKIIFDGFDEYILWNKGNIDPIEALQNISTLANISGSKIIVTTRTSFWNTVSAESGLEALADNILAYEMVPFDRNQAVEYFTTRFTYNSNKVSNCTRLYDLAKTNIKGDKDVSFVGRGFILNLIADLVERSDSLPDITKAGSTLLQWIMYSLCEREETRQKLPLNAEEQITICREFAEIISCGEEPSTENLTEVIRCCKDTLPENMIASLVDLSAKQGSLKDHPLIRKGVDGWYFIHEQIYFNLLAEQIIDYAVRGSKRLKKIVDEIIDKGTFLDDVASAIVQQAIISADMNDDKIVNIIGFLLSLTDTSDGQNYRSNKLATTLALNALESLIAAGEAASVRTKIFMSLLPNNKMKNLYFTRTISRMDLSNNIFNSCTFDQVTFANCHFSRDTIFEKCYFVGGNISYCKNFGLSRFVDIKADQAADRLIKLYQANDGAKNYDKEMLRQDISDFLYKFTDRGTTKIKNVAESNFFTGIFGKSCKRNEIVKAIKKSLIVPHFLSRGTDITYTIADTAVDSYRHFLTNGVFTGPLADIFNELKEKLFL